MNNGTMTASALGSSSSMSSPSLKRISTSAEFTSNHPRSDTQRESLDPPSQLIGTSRCFRELKRQIAVVAGLEKTTLIEGGTGSGKEEVARRLHADSARRTRPFIPVHCGALPEGLFEAELFGHARGAFTGANQRRDGLIKTATAGTLFLDEVDSLSLPAQSKLLRFLDTGEYRPVGSDRTEKASAWVIAASNQNLNELVNKRRFRADLLYRLQVLTLCVPSLAERGDDVIVLARHFLATVTRGKKRFSHAAEQAILAQRWPGNVRQLKHRVEAAALLSPGQLVDETFLSPNILSSPGPGDEAPELDLEQADAQPTSLDSSRDVTAAEAAPPSLDDARLQELLWSLVTDRGLSLSGATQVFEQMLVSAALRAEDNNRTRAARRLGINVRTVYKKLNRG